MGTTGAGPFSLDLRRDGPHLLVGGTTGSGKSEFLRTLVTALAVDSSPRDVTMLLVDFKGGAGFGPCADLPHVVGLVTDLDDHLVHRMLVSLRAELRRREALLADVGAADLDDPRAQVPRATGTLPRLVVVVDELRALVDAHPDTVGALVRLAAQGRSLGVHLVLATQRPAGTVTAEVQANIDLRIAFRVRDVADSVSVVEDPAAALLPADVPGRGVARPGGGPLTPFQAALVAPAEDGRATVTVRAAGSEVEPAASGAADRSATVATVVATVRRAFTASGTSPPPPPWLPPLPAELPLAGQPLGTLAVVDDPERQRQTPWVWRPEVPLWRVVGPPRSGRSQALRSLVLAATAVLPPDRLHVQVLAAGSALTALGTLPHVGTVADVDDTAAVDAVLDHLEGLPPGGAPDSVQHLLVVDGVDRLLDDVPGAPVSRADRLVRLVRDTGVGAAVAGGRELLRSRWSALAGEVLVLGPSDPLDAALLGLPVARARADRPPGGGVRGRDGREVQVVWAGPSLHGPRRPEATTGPAPWTYRALPRVVRRADLVPSPGARAGSEGWLLGAAGPQAVPCGWAPGRHGRLLLVVGPAGAGRSSTLRAVAGSAAAAGRPHAWVGADRPPGDLRGCEVVGPTDVDRLVRLRAAHPDLLLLVDDADRLDDAPVRPVLDEVVDLVERDGGAVAVVTSTTALGARFRGLDVTVARARHGLLLRPTPDDAHLLGLPRSAVSREDRPAGRGLLVRDGVAVPIQVLLDDVPLTPGRRAPRPAGAP